MGISKVTFHSGFSVLLIEGVDCRAFPKVTTKYCGLLILVSREEGSSSQGHSFHSCLSPLSSLPSLTVSEDVTAVVWTAYPDNVGFENQRFGLVYGSGRTSAATVIFRSISRFGAEAIADTVR